MLPHTSLAEVVAEPAVVVQLTPVPVAAVGVIEFKYAAMSPSFLIVNWYVQLSPGFDNSIPDAIVTWVLLTVALVHVLPTEEDPPSVGVADVPVNPTSHSTGFCLTLLVIMLLIMQQMLH